MGSTLPADRDRLETPQKLYDSAQCGTGTRQGAQNCSFRNKHLREALFQVLRKQCLGFCGGPRQAHENKMLSCIRYNLLKVLQTVLTCELPLNKLPKSQWVFFSSHTSLDSSISKAFE